MKKIAVFTAVLLIAMAILPSAAFASEATSSPVKAVASSACSLHIFPTSSKFGTATAYVNDGNSSTHQIIYYDLRRCPNCGEEAAIETGTSRASHSYSYASDAGHQPGNKHAYNAVCICKRTVVYTYTCYGNPCVYPQ